MNHTDNIPVKNLRKIPNSDHLIISGVITVFTKLLYLNSIQIYFYPLQANLIHIILSDIKIENTKYRSDYLLTQGNKSELRGYYFCKAVRFSVKPDHELVNQESIHTIDNHTSDNININNINSAGPNEQ